MRNKELVFALALAGGVLAPTAHAITLQEAAQQAVLSNPDVQARWRAFNGAVSQQDAARGAYFPRVDIAASSGREHLSQPNQPESSFDHRNLSATLSQTLFDGFATRNEVRRQGYNKLVRYFELMDASESAALEAARAYYDVLRYRKLIGLAEENYAQHKNLFDLMDQRAKAGVGRRVDLEQAGGRLALAESNLLTEITNLHDVSARYQRIIGDLPPAELSEPELLQKGMPGDSKSAVSAAIQQSPTLAAAVEGIRAAKSDLDGRGSSFSPKLDVRARQDLDRNLYGVLGNRNDRVIELVLNYNLFRGGADSALKRQAAENLNAAKDVRDRTCRDVRQTLVIAYNDTSRLVEQLRYLNTHQLASEKVRDAYRKQFDIGQRTLLDLLDTENELFQARRAYVIAQYDQAIAFARTHAAIGDLLHAMNLRHVDVPSLAALGEDRYAVDPSTACPPEAPSMQPVDKAAVLARLASENPAPVISPVAKPAPLSDQAQVEKAVQDWAEAWRGRSPAAYLALYAPAFKPAHGISREVWATQRRENLTKAKSIELSLEDVKVQLFGQDEASATFQQHFSSGAYRDTVHKTLRWRRVDGRWLIVEETAVK